MSGAEIPIYLLIASTAATVYSTYQQSKEQTEAEHDIRKQEKRAAEQARKIAGQKAEDEAKRHKAILATQEARYAASGVTMEGSPLLVKMESLRESEEQLRRIREGGEYEYLTHKELAQSAGKRASAATTSGYVSAAGQGTKGTYNIGKEFDWW